MYWSPAPLLQDTSTDPQPGHVRTCSTWTSLHSYPQVCSNLFTVKCALLTSMRLAFNWDAFWYSVWFHNFLDLLDTVWSPNGSPNGQCPSQIYKSPPWFIFCTPDWSASEPKPDPNKLSNATNQTFLVKPYPHQNVKHPAPELIFILLQKSGKVPLQYIL